MSIRPVHPATLLFAGFAAGSPALAQRCALEWSTQFSPGAFDREPSALASHDEGQGAQLYAMGWFFRGGGLDDTGGIVGWDGSSWNRLGAGAGTIGARAAASFDDGGGPALFADGYFGPHPSPRIGRWRDGQWTAVPGSAGIGNVTAMRMLDDGGGSALYIADWTGFPRVSRVNRWDGTSLTTVGGAFGTPNIGVEIHALHVHDEGIGPSLYAGGDFMWINGINQLSRYLARWDGAQWVQVIPFEFHIGGIKALATIDPDGNGSALLVCGVSLNVAGSPVTGLGYWRNNVWTRIGGVYDCACMTTADVAGQAGAYFSGTAAYNSNPGLFFYAGGAVVQLSEMTVEAEAMVAHDDGSGMAIHMAGRFLDGDQHIADGVAKWDGQTILPVGTTDRGNAFKRSIRALQALPDPVNGEARLFASALSATLAGRHSAIGIWDGDAWDTTAKNFEYLASASSFARFDDAGGVWIYAAGSFPNGASPRPTLIRWDGTQWEDVSNGMQYGRASAMLAHDDGSGPALYLGGTPMTTPSLDPSRLLRFRAGVWSYVGAPLTSGTIRKFAVYDGGHGPDLYMGGSSLEIGGQQYRGLARWDGTQWHQLPAGNASNGYVYDMVVFDDGGGDALYVFGTSLVPLPVPPGVLRDALRWNGAAWSHISSAGEPQQTLRAAAVFDDGSGPAIYAGGSNSSGVILSRFDGQSWTEVSRGEDWNGSISHLAVLEEGSPGSPRQALYIGGDFRIANGIPAGYITRYGCPPEPSCYANCDGSSVTPILNVDDFTCFINEYATGQALPPAQQVSAYANCDGSSVAPVLNVDDFTCFINQYALGCP